MKIKNIFFAVLALFISQSILATKFTIMNFVNNNRYINVDPVWSGKPRVWEVMAQGMPKSFDSGLHHLQMIRWKLPSGWCWRANVEDILGGFWGRARTGVKIKLYDNGIYTIDLGQGEGMPRQADKGNC